MTWIGFEKKTGNVVEVRMEAIQGFEYEPAGTGEGQRSPAQLTLFLAGGARALVGNPGISLEELRKKLRGEREEQADERDRAES